MEKFEKCDTAQRSVLVVDDDEVMREYILLVLQQENYVMHEAVNGKDALSIYKLHSPDLVLTDVEMPEMDGLVLTRTIRESDSNIPIIVMSSDKINLRLAEGVGANNTLHKPLSSDVVLDIIWSLMKTRFD